MKIRDRIVELRRVPARDLLPDPRNWRTHPKAQREALQGLLSEIGYADALLARETPKGLMLIDGHLRAETTPDTEVPVLVLDVDEKEAAKLLASLDPLAAMAGADDEHLAEILRNVETSSDAVKAMLAMSIEACQRHGRYVGICGQGPSDHPDLAEWLMDQGISSISLNPDTVVDTWTRLATHKKG